MEALTEAAITMSRADARAKVAEYVRSVRERLTAEDQAILRGYRTLAKGYPVVDLPACIRAGGVHDDGLPRLAVATASHAWVWVRRDTDGHVTFLPQPWRQVNSRRRKDVYRMPVGTLPAMDRPPNPGRWFEDHPWSGNYRAMVPHVPPSLRPAHSLDGYAVLFEADDWALDPTAPKDPALLKRIGGDLYAVVATWDLTPLEQAVLNGRNR